MTPSCLSSARAAARRDASHVLCALRRRSIRFRHGLWALCEAMPLACRDFQGWPSRARCREFNGTRRHAPAPCVFVVGVVWCVLCSSLCGARPGVSAVARGGFRAVLCAVWVLGLLFCWHLLSWLCRVTCRVSVVRRHRNSPFSTDLRCVSCLLCLLPGTGTVARQAVFQPLSPSTGLPETLTCTCKCYPGASAAGTRTKEFTRPTSTRIALLPSRRAGGQAVTLSRLQARGGWSGAPRSQERRCP